MKSIFTLIIGLLMLCSCSPELVPFTSQVERDIGLSKQQLTKVQFFNSTPIVLYRELSKNTTEVVSGEVKIVDGKQVEEIVIAPRTPGVIVSSSSERMGISFEKGADRYLVFGLNKHKSGAYTVLARDWNNNIGYVDYDGREYSISAQSAATFLMINMQKLKNLNVKSRTAKGRTVGEL
ncbi:MAG: hypothetical protein OER04_11790 [Cyclobacteriaceae bacterium]|nr:hypothetical protein [Cyclobacteriaceae bacterium]